MDNTTMNNTTLDMLFEEHERMHAMFPTMDYVEFDADIARLIRTFVFSDVRKDVYAKMVFLEGKMRWLICANMAGVNPLEPSYNEYLVPEAMKLGEALRLFPEFHDVV